MNEEQLLNWRKSLKQKGTCSDLQKCNAYGEVLPVSEFGKPRTYYNKNKNIKYQYWYCKNCRQKSKRKQLLSQFGITQEQYDDLVVKQNGCCAICGKRPLKRRLVIDHDHVTGKIRGLLCQSCNVLIGLAKECPDIFKYAIEYLEKNE